MNWDRVMALWFPDWPVHAALLSGTTPVSGSDSAVVVAGSGTSCGKVKVCGPQARAVGIRRGMRLRQARAVCPGLIVFEDCPDRDARIFEPFVASVSGIAATVEVLRPGLIIVDAAAAGRYHGGEDAVAQQLIDSVGIAGVDCLVGIADEIPTALIAARVGAVVPAGGSRVFLAPRPIRLAAAEETLGCDPDVVTVLAELGVSTFGELAALPATAVTTRFGVPGEKLHRLACAESDRTVLVRQPTAPLQVAHRPDSPVGRIDEAAFLARSLATRLHGKLVSAGLCCQRLKVRATILVGGEESVLERIWHTREPLTEQATAERVRWQLDGWLTAQLAAGDGTEDTVDSGIVELVLEPIEVMLPEDEGLWAARGSDDGGARRVITRVQSILGMEAVLRPQLTGGRSPVERIRYVPVGEDRSATKDPRGRWPGMLPGPYPARRGGGPPNPDSGIRLVDAGGKGVRVTAEALLDRIPCTAYVGATRYRITGWAGPWPVDELWWEPESAHRCARMQIIAEAVSGCDDRAWLVVWGSGSWRIEASYR